MKKYFVLCLCLLVVAGCGSDEAQLNPEPEIAPICPEGYHWIDTIKSCEILEAEMLQ